MNKVQHLTISGTALLIAGASMLASENIGISIAKILIPLLFVVSGIFSILFSNANSQAKMPSRYHMIHGIGLVVFGVIFGLAPESLADFLSYATYFILFFGLFEIIIGFSLVNSDFKFRWEVLIARFFAGFFGLIGAVLILATSVTNEMSGLMITGIVTILIGMGIIIFSTKLKNISTQ